MGEPGPDRVDDEPNHPEPDPPGSAARKPTDAQPDPSGPATAEGMPAGTTPADPPSLLVWSLAGFHSALLVALAVVALYATGRAGVALAGLDTVVGVVAYLYLWGVSWWTNRSMLRGLDGDLLAGEPGLGAVLAAAAGWGGLAGVLVLLPALVVGVVLVVAQGGLDAVPFLLLAAAVGGVLAAAVGVVVGAVLCLLDWFLLAAARRYVAGRPGQSVPGPTDTP